MELECTNLNGEIVLGSKTKPCGIFFWKIVRIAFKNESYKLFFQEDALIAQEKRLSIAFSYQIQMEWIKAFHVGKNIIYEEKQFQKRHSNFEIFFATPSPMFWTYLGMTFVPGYRLKNIYIPMKLIISSIFNFF